MANPLPPEMVSVGSIFIDDIVLPSGQTFMNQLGGAVTHAAMGAALWGARVGITAVYGLGLRHDILAHINNHLDSRGLVELPIVQMRAWQIFEEDGERRELFRVKETEPFTRGPDVDHLPEVYKDVPGYYFLRGMDIEEWLPTLQNALICWEPSQRVMLKENASEFRRVLRQHQVQIVSPNLLEAEAIYGRLRPEQFTEALLTDGAHCVVLRMGADGALLRQQQDDTTTHVPAVNLPQIVDQTGAGNTFCGAFLLGRVRGLTLKEAGCMGGVSASFCIEQQGVVNPALVSPKERDQRLHQLLEKAT